MGKRTRCSRDLNGCASFTVRTGEKKYLEAVKIAWEDVVKNRLYITGSGSAGEQLAGRLPSPERRGSKHLRDCVTVTWEQLNIQLLRLTGEAKYADQLERSVYNHLLGAQKPTADAWAYYTPLIGHKPYGSSTNCCLSSGPRGVALLPTFVYAGSNEAQSSISTRLRLHRLRYVMEVVSRSNSGQSIRLTEALELKVSPKGARKKFTLSLRVPAWSGELHEVEINAVERQYGALQAVRGARPKLEIRRPGESSILHDLVILYRHP